MEKPSHPTCRWSSRRTCTERGSAPSGGASYTLAASQTARNVSVSTAIAPTPGGELSKKKSGRVTLTCVGLKVGARWRVCGCDRGARLAAIAPMSVGKMVNRIGMGDVDAQWFRRASNPHPPGPQPDALPTAPQSVGRFSRPAGTARPCGSRVTEERVRPVARMRRSCRIRVVPSAGFEPATPTLGRWRSIH